MKFNKIKSLIESNKELKLTKNSDSEIVIESSKSANKLKASLNENRLKITLENELGGEIENYESPVISSDDLVDKIKDAINLYDMIDDLNIDFDESEDIEEVPEDDLGEEIELIDAETGEEVDTCCDGECDEPESANPVGDFDNDGEDEELLNEETNPFSEIIDMMSNAESYDELYTAAGLIADEGLRVSVEELIGQCEDDGDDVETAYSVVTSDLLDDKVNDLNESKYKRESNGLKFKVGDMVPYKGKNYKVTKAIPAHYWNGYNSSEDNAEGNSFVEFTDSMYEIQNPDDKRDWGYVKAKDLELQENITEDIDSEEIPERETVGKRLSSIQDSMTNSAKELSDLATETNDAEMMSVIMDLANSVSSCALDIEDAIETVDDLEESEEGEELEQIDATNENESLLLKLRMNLTESKLIAKKLARKDSENRGLYEKYINSVNDIL